MQKNIPELFCLRAETFLFFCPQAFSEYLSALNSQLKERS